MKSRKENADIFNKKPGHMASCLESCLKRCEKSTSPEALYIMGNCNLDINEGKVSVNSLLLRIKLHILNLQSYF